MRRRRRLGPPHSCGPVGGQAVHGCGSNCGPRRTARVQAPQGPQLAGQRWKLHGQRHGPRVSHRTLQPTDRKQAAMAEELKVRGGAASARRRHRMVLGRPQPSIAAAGTSSKPEDAAGMQQHQPIAACRPLPCRCRLCRHRCRCCLPSQLPSTDIPPHRTRATPPSRPATLRRRRSTSLPPLSWTPPIMCFFPTARRPMPRSSGMMRRCRMPNKPWS